MSYFDTMVAAVPMAGQDAYIEHAKSMSPLFLEHGAVRLIEAWGDDVPDGKVTDFKRSVQAKPDETVVVSFIEWPSKEARDAAWEKLMQDERMMNSEFPFDGKRLIHGGFKVILNA